MNYIGRVEDCIEWRDTCELQEWLSEWVCYDSDVYEHRYHIRPRIQFSRSEIEREMIRRRELEREDEGWSA